MADRRMFRYVVPIDDRPHQFNLTGDPVAVAAAGAARVEFWAEHTDDHTDATATTRAFQVFGTGQPLPPGARWIGTCPRIGGLVWHLYEVTHD